MPLDPRPDPKSIQKFDPLEDHADSYRDHVYRISCVDSLRFIIHSTEIERRRRKEIHRELFFQTFPTLGVEPHLADRHAAVQF